MPCFIDKYAHLNNVTVTGINRNEYLDLPVTDVEIVWNEIWKEMKNRKEELLLS